MTQVTPLPRESHPPPPLNKLNDIKLHFCPEQHGFRIKFSHRLGIYVQHDAVHAKLRRWRRHSGRENEGDPCSSTCRGKTTEPQQRHRPVGQIRQMSQFKRKTQQYKLNSELW